ncbi:hypothetical protein FQZ97_472480 [compost metagenome]
MSTPPATLLASSPICRVPMLAACSTTSRPRKMSPSASGRVLPCSAVRMAASSFMFSRISCWYLRKMRARAPIGVLRQVLKASLALATAAFISSSVAKGTRARTSWVAGLTTSRHWLVRDSTSWPPISSLTVGMEVLWVMLVVLSVGSLVGAGAFGAEGSAPLGERVFSGPSRPAGWGSLPRRTPGRPACGPGGVAARCGAARRGGSFRRWSWATR